MIIYKSIRHLLGRKPIVRPYRRDDRNANIQKYVSGSFKPRDYLKYCNKNCYHHEGVRTSKGNASEHYILCLLQANRLVTIMWRTPDVVTEPLQAKRVVPDHG